MFVPLSVSHEELVATWWSDKNTLLPDEVSRGMRKPALWQCPKVPSHLFPAGIAGMVRRPGCRLCSKQLVIPGINDAMTTHRDIILRYFDFSSNTIDPSAVAAGTAKKAWWKCDSCAYRWYTSFLSVTRGSGCARCAGVIANPGVTTVDVLFPQLVEEYWDYECNEKSPEEVTKSSSYIVGFRCPKCKEKWKTSAYNFFSIGTRCPVCANKKVVIGINDLSTTDPEIIEKNWSPTNKRSPTEMVRGSQEKVEWICDNGHIRYCSPYEYVVQATRCGQCLYPESKSQQEVREYVRTIYTGKVIDKPTRTIIPPKEIDIYLPDIHLAIEVNGVFHHSTYYTAHRDARRDQDKSILLFNAGVNFLGIWTDDWELDQDSVKMQLRTMINTLIDGKPFDADSVIDDKDNSIDLYYHYGQIMKPGWEIESVIPPKSLRLYGSVRVSDIEKNKDLPEVYDYGRAIVKRKSK